MLNLSVVIVVVLSFYASWLWNLSQRVTGMPLMVKVRRTSLPHHPPSGRCEPLLFIANEIAVGIETTFPIEPLDCESSVTGSPPS